MVNQNIHFCDFRDPIKGISQYPDNYFDLCLTDPPYGINYRGVTHGSDVNEKQYNDKELDFSWLDLLLQKCDGVMFTCGTTHLFDWVRYRKPNYQLKVCYLPDTGRIHHLDYVISYGKIHRYNHMRDVFVIKAPKVKNHKFIHPSPKSIEIWDYIIKKLQPKRVLDPFAGSGVTMEACIKENIECVCYEIDETFKPDVEKRITLGKKIHKIGRLHI